VEDDRSTVNIGRRSQAAFDSLYLHWRNDLGQGVVVPGLLPRLTKREKALEGGGFIDSVIRYDELK
jgi:hypothetical protein